MVEIERVSAASRQREQEIRERLERMNDWMHATKRALLDIDARTSGRVAADHGRPTASRGEAEAQDSSGRLRERYEARTREHAELTRAFSDLIRVGDELEAERAVRTSLDDHERAIEDRARRTRSESGAGFALPTVDGLRR